MNELGIRPILLGFLLSLSCTWPSFASSPAEWKNWTQKLQDRYSEKLATPSIAHYTYLEQPSESAFVDSQRRPRFVKKLCETCTLKVTWSSQHKVLVEDLTSSRKMTFKVGQSEVVPWKSNLYFSTYEVDRLKRLRVFIHDLSDHLLTNKRKRHFFPHNPKTLLDAKWVWLSQPRKIKMQRSDGSSEEMSAIAELHFFVGDEKQILSVYDYAEKENIVRQQENVLLLFRDLSNGRQTYGAGRFMFLQIGKKVGEIKNGDKIILDFNYSYNPPCSVSEGFHCPLPQDFINLDIQAGEKYSKTH